MYYLILLLESLWLLLEIFFLLVFYFIFNIYTKANENALRSNWRGGNRRGFSLLWRLLISLMKEFWSCITISSSIWYNGLKSFMNYNYTLYWLFHHFLIHCTEEEVGWSLSKRKVCVASWFLISHFYPYALGFSRWFKIRTLHWGAFCQFLSGGFTTMAVINTPERNWQNASLCSVLILNHQEKPSA